MAHIHGQLDRYIDKLFTTKDANVSDGGYNDSKITIRCV